MIVYIYFLPNDQLQYCIIQTVLADTCGTYQDVIKCDRLTRLAFYCVAASSYS